MEDIEALEELTLIIKGTVVLGGTDYEEEIITMLEILTDPEE